MFGFVGDLAAEQPGDARPPREGHLRTYFTDFDGPPPISEPIELGGTPFDIRSSRRGWITIFNRGRSSSGFRYCSTCGYATDPVPTSGRSRAGAATPHTRPTGGSGTPCNGSLRRLDLGHRFLTNVIQLDVPTGGTRWSPTVVAQSTLHALIAAAPTIGISQSDLGGSIGINPMGVSTLVVFDDVPGGAGHTRHLKDHLDELVIAALHRVTSCSCGVDTSCYGCLRGYRNQLHHDELVRGAAIEVLQSLIGVPA
jgi:Domain of unknown function (DUF1998)